MYKPKLKIVTKVGRSVVNIDKKKRYTYVEETQMQFRTRECVKFNPNTGDIRHIKYTETHNKFTCIIG